jgi:hypothetical protein
VRIGLNDKYELISLILLAPHSSLPALCRSLALPKSPHRAQPHGEELGCSDRDVRPLLSAGTVYGTFRDRLSQGQKLDTRKKIDA